MTARLAIFDCDGTLVDSQANICTAMEDAFAAARLDPPAREATRRVVGLSLVEAMRALMPAGDGALHMALAEEYRRAFHGLRAAGAVHEPLFEGVVECLDALESRGWRLAVATGKSDRGLGLVLDSHGLGDRFAIRHTADRHPSKPHPAMIEACLADAGAPPEAAVMIGDTSYDIAMARAAGVLAIGVAWGYHAHDELRAEGADWVADHPSAIPPWLEART